MSIEDSSLPPLLWLRDEEKPGERRSAITPKECAALVSSGFQVKVEKSAMRAFEDSEFAAAGGELVEAGSWREAPKEAWILGLKELSDQQFDLVHRHIHFGHAFKGQTGWQKLISRFDRGGGVLYDLENLEDETGRRIAAFGYWAGFVGAAFGVEAWLGRKAGNLPGLKKVEPVESKDELIEKLSTSLKGCGDFSSVLITGALGRCGTGASDLCHALGIEPVKWDLAETASGGPFPQILDHDIFVNCVLASPQTPVFVPKEALEMAGRKLSVIADVSCDPTSSYNPVAVYDRSTTFDEPTVIVGEVGNELEVMAIDHLPSHLPREASEDYAAQLLPALLDLMEDKNGIWSRAKNVYETVRSDLWTG